MNCDECEHLGFSGNSKVCGWLLHGGETVYVRNGRIPEPCPKFTFEQYRKLKDTGKIKGAGGEE